MYTKLITNAIQPRAVADVAPPPAKLPTALPAGLPVSATPDGRTTGPRPERAALMRPTADDLAHRAAAGRRAAAGQRTADAQTRRLKAASHSLRMTRRT
jgi:hypothetical protein